MMLWDLIRGLFRFKWYARGGPTSQWLRCSKCQGFGMLEFISSEPFTQWHFDNLSIEQLRSIGIECNICGGREAIPEEDNR